METIAIVKLSTGNEYHINQETYQQILEASDNDLIQLSSGTTFKKSSVMEITSVQDYKEKNPTYNYGEPYSFGPNDRAYSWEEIKQLPASGFDGILTSAERDVKRRHINLTAFLKGLNKAKTNLLAKNQTVRKVDAIIKKTQEKLASPEKLPF